MCVERQGGGCASRKGNEEKGKDAKNDKGSEKRVLKEMAEAPEEF